MEKTIIAFIAGSIVAIISSWLAHIFSERRRRKEEFNRAASIFRSAFTRELRNLRSVAHPEGLEWDFVYNLIQKSILRHEIVYMRFEAYLSCEEVPAFHSAWRKYSNPSSIKKEENPNPLLDYYAEGKTVKECIHLAASNIEELLKFAKPK